MYHKKSKKLQMLHVVSTAMKSITPLEQHENYTYFRKVLRPRWAKKKKKITCTSMHETVWLSDVIEMKLQGNNCDEAQSQRNCCQQGDVCGLLAVDWLSWANYE